MILYCQRSMTSKPSETRVFRFGEYQSRLRDSKDRIGFVNSPDGARLLEQELKTALFGRGIRLLSLDVFDTVLLRRPICELSRFLEFAGAHAAILGEYQGQPIERVDVLAARLAAAKAAHATGRRAGTTHEGHYDDIVKAMTSGLGIQPNRELGGQIAEAEIALEADLFTVPNGPLIDAIPAIVDEGLKVILFSDMYLHSQNIERLMELHGLEAADLEIHTSSDRSVAKRNGSAFPWMQNLVGLNPAQCLHIGDNPRSDFSIPIDAGWRARLWPISDSDAKTIAQDHAATVDRLDSMGFAIPAGWANLEVVP